MIRRNLRVGAIGALLLVPQAGAGCSTGSSSSPASGASAAVQVPPRVPDMTPLDGDDNRVDDAIDRENAAGNDAVIPVEAVFRAEPPPNATVLFEAAGGKVRRVLHGIGYGFTGKIARSAIPALTPKLGSDLLLIKAEQVVVPHLAESTRTSRARAVWQNGFAGSASGFNGSAKVNIAIVDSGVDPTHLDLAGRMVGYKDYTSENVPTAEDKAGHGTHVAGIALGSGAAFGVGPGTLKVTESGSDASLQANDFNNFGYHLPSSFDLTATATFEGGGTTALAFFRADDGSNVWHQVSTSAVQTSPLSFTFNGTAASNSHYTMGLRQNAARDVTRFAIAASITNYPAVGDGFPALRGVAPRSGYYVAKIFPVLGEATSDDITDALQDIYDLREALDIKVINCSFGISGGGTDPAQRAKVSSLVDHGIVVVATSGNNGPSGATGDPGRAADAITVGATNDANQVTSYSSGASKTAADTDDKPDIVAPGGSVYHSKVLSVDSSSSDAASATFADVQKDDYTSNMGTSMAAPIVTGAAALVIQALEANGVTWDFASSKTSHLVKMLLLAAATETNQPRETNTVNPSLGRGDAPKDIQEGYGLVNVDAAIEAATTTWNFEAPLVGSTSGGAYDRRAWGRKVHVAAGRTLKLTMTNPLGGDFDVYAYTSTPSDRGTPQLQMWSANAGMGVREETTWTFLDETDLYLFVKRIDGGGTFTLNGITFTCGNGTIEPGEECDDSNVRNGDCCNVACQLEDPRTCRSDAGTIPDDTDAGSSDAGADASDAATDDAGDAGAPDSAPPPVAEPEPEPTPTPTGTSSSTSGSAVAPVPTEPVERFSVGGGCATTPSRHDAGAGLSALGVALACTAFARRRRRD